MVWVYNGECVEVGFGLDQVLNDCLISNAAGIMKRCSALLILLIYVCFSNCYQELYQVKVGIAARLVKRSEFERSERLVYVDFDFRRLKEVDDLFVLLLHYCQPQGLEELLLLLVL